MEPNLINESRLFDELAELFLHISNTFAQLASHRRNASNSVSPKSNAIPSNSWDIPQKGKYNQVREYIKVRKKEDPDFREYCLRHSLREICSYLTDEFGWDVNEHSLGANLNRH